MCRMTGYSSVIPLPAEDRAGAAADLDRAADVPHLAEADVLRPERACVLHAAEVERDERGAVDLERHLRELLLGELVGGDRLLEHDPLLRVVERRLEAGASRADGPKTIPYRASLRQDSGPRSVVAPGRRFSSGTRTSSSTSSEVTDARSESFLWISGAREARACPSRR